MANFADITFHGFAKNPRNPRKLIDAKVNLAKINCLTVALVTNICSEVNMLKVSLQDIKTIIQNFSKLTIKMRRCKMCLYW